MWWEGAGLIVHHPSNVVIEVWGGLYKGGPESFYCCSQTTNTAEGKRRSAAEWEIKSLKNNKTEEKREYKEKNERMRKRRDSSQLIGRAPEEMRNRAAGLEWMATLSMCMNELFSPLSIHTHIHTHMKHVCCGCEGLRGDRWRPSSLQFVCCVETYSDLFTPHLLLKYQRHWTWAEGGSVHVCVYCMCACESCGAGELQTGSLRKWMASKFGVLEQ